MVIQHRNFLKDFGFIIPLMGLFAVIYVNTKWLFIFVSILLKQAWLPVTAKAFLDRAPHLVMAEFIAPLRGILLIVSLVSTGIVIWKNVHKESFRLVSFPKLSLVAAGYLALLLLVFPSGLAGMSFEYSNTSLVLFSKLQPINGEERFLLPALAHVLFFRGPVFYVIFSLLLNFLLVYCVFFWFSRNNLTFSMLDFVSLGTISFIMNHFHAQGYPDVLVHIFVLLAITLPVGPKGFLGLFALSLATHEASVFVWAVLALFMLDKESWLKFIIILTGYIFLRSASQGFELNAVVSPRDVGEMTSAEWVYFNLEKLFLGIFWGFKGGWVIIVAALFGWAKEAAWKQFLFVFALLVAGVVMALMAIDTSRLIGWVFPALLFSWKFLLEAKNTLYKKILQFAVVANLLIPPMYFGLNVSDVPRGLYEMIGALAGLR